MEEYLGIKIDLREINYLMIWESNVLKKVT
jgi:hypothetical protein